MLLKEIFIALTQNYTNDHKLVAELWKEIEDNYTGTKRHYHTLEHLENLWIQLNKVKVQILDWNTVLFTLFYHDVIYNSLKTNNEEKSAELAGKRMQAMSVPWPMIEKCKAQIMATKKHLASDNDTNYFMDADLSILGQDWFTYAIYFKHVRKEYSIYPDLVYIPGRKKVLDHFLKMVRIFKTDLFFEKFEVQAKYNLQKELETM